jgi:hypothetical protein
MYGMAITDYIRLRERPNRRLQLTAFGAQDRAVFEVV